jgi:hypothetical protein
MSVSVMQMRLEIEEAMKQCPEALTNVVLTLIQRESGYLKDDEVQNVRDTAKEWWKALGQVWQRANDHLTEL